MVLDGWWKGESEYSSPIWDQTLIHLVAPSPAPWLLSYSSWQQQIWKTLQSGPSTLDNEVLARFHWDVHCTRTTAVGLSGGWPPCTLLWASTISSYTEYHGRYHHYTIHWYHWWCWWYCWYCSLLPILLILHTCSADTRNEFATAASYSLQKQSLHNLESLSSKNIGDFLEK